MTVNRNSSLTGGQYTIPLISILSHSFRINTGALLKKSSLRTIKEFSSKNFNNYPSLVVNEIKQTTSLVV